MVAGSCRLRPSGSTLSTLSTSQVATGHMTLTPSGRSHYSLAERRGRPVAEEDDWLPASPGGGATAATPDLRARDHRRTASLDNILDRMKDMELTIEKSCERRSKMAADATSATAGGANLKNRLKTISERLMKKPPTVFNRLRSSKSKTSTPTSSTSWHHIDDRRLSSATLPALDEFHRHMLSSDAHDDADDADTDSGIVQEWSDTGSVSDASCVLRHYQPQPCQTLSSWRKPAPRVRTSLSPIFQYKPKHMAEIDGVGSSEYETLWPPQLPQASLDVVDFHKR